MAATENTTAAAGYILTFLNELDQLTHCAATYCNVITEIKGRFPGDDDLKKLDDTERLKLTQSVNFARYWCIRTSVKLEALAPKIPAFQKSLEEMKKLKKPIIETPVPDYAAVDAYVTKINKLFVAGVMSELLTKAQDVYNKYTGQESGQ